MNKLKLFSCLLGLAALTSSCETGVDITHSLSNAHADSDLSVDPADELYFTFQPSDSGKFSMLSLYHNGRLIRGIGVNSTVPDVLCIYWNDTLKYHTSQIPVRFDLDLSRLKPGVTDTIRGIASTYDKVNEYQDMATYTLALKLK